VSPFEESAAQLKVAAQAMRAAHAALPLGWPEHLNLPHSAAALDRVAKAVQEGIRKAAVDARCGLITRKEAGRLIGSIIGPDGLPDPDMHERKRKGALEGSYAKREAIILQMKKELFWEIIRAVKAGGAVKEVAAKYRIREETLEDWARTYEPKPVDGESG
jgi:hypothetical protein